jgi:antibiotic biosynthesis monooxygenase (ABM) superfamily enzyme
MYLVTLVTAYVQGLLLGEILATPLRGLPLLVREAATTIVFTTLLTFVLLPWLTRLLRGWLYPGTDS